MNDVRVPTPARCSGAASLKKTRKRVLTRRGVMWLGQTCNQRCYFCYFANRIADKAHPEHEFMSIDKAKWICKTLRDFYGNTSIDIQGGEPTIYADILELITYCRNIGLYPTLITNGLALARPGMVERYRDAGLRDFLVSLHGIGDVHDEVVGVKGAYAKIVAAIENMVGAGIPFRYNCTMSKPVIPVLSEVARKAVEYGAYAVNYIAFNPFGDQGQGIRTRENVAAYSEIKPRLAEAVDILEESDIEANIRYLPHCMVEERHRKNSYNYEQLSYDTHEWDYQSWLWTMMQTQMMKGGGLVPPYRLGPFYQRVMAGNAVALARVAEERRFAMGLKFAAQRTAGRIAQTLRGKDALYRDEARSRASVRCRYRYHEVCGRCMARNICDGFHGDYAEFFGTAEAVPIMDIPLTDDPRFYIREQEKTVEPEDESWAL